MSRGIVANVMEVAGFTALIGGLVLVSWPLAIVAFGGFLILAALAIQKVG